MPRQKQKKVVKNKTTSSRSSAKTSLSQRKKATKSQRLQSIRTRFEGSRWTESYNSFLLGIVVVIIAVLFVASFLRQSNKIQDTSSLAITPTPTSAPTVVAGSTYTEGGKTYYVVKANDSLWTIAQKIYSDGYKWTDIAKANNLSDPGTIFKEDRLLIPSAPAPSTLGEINKEQNSQRQTDAISGTTYTVQKGDSLWTIAVRAYADGYKWESIAKANNLANPNLIFSGNQLVLPRN